MTPHDPETTGILPEQLLSPEHVLSEPLHKLGQACEALQTWASDLASARQRKPSMSQREARLDRAKGEALLADVLAKAAPVLGELGSVAGGGQ